jgi:mevalonate kinase
MSTLPCSASAPGKVILFGEHAVVYGHPAVAAALSDLRITVKITPKPSSTKITVQMLDLPVPVHVSFPNESLRMPSLHQPPTNEDADAIHKVILMANAGLDDMSVSALTPLVYLINEISPTHLDHGLDIEVRSQDLPVGAGLGSSAAFSVAASAALIGLSLPRPPGLGRPTPDQLEHINQFAFYSEILLHGTPSGIDNSVSTFGGAIDFTKINGVVTMNHFAMPTLDMVLTNTHVPRSTMALVAHVKAMKDNHPAVVDCVLQGMGAIATQFREFRDICTKGDLVLTLVRTNQHLLRAVGVSHPTLDCICKVVDDVAHGDAATKLTGAGGGGCSMTVLKPGCDPELSKTIQCALESQPAPWSFTCLRSSVGREGVLWIDPLLFPKARPKQKNSDAWVSRVLLGSLAAAAIGAAIILTRRTKK